MKSKVFKCHYTVDYPLGVWKLAKMNVFCDKKVLSNLDVTKIAYLTSHVISKWPPSRGDLVHVQKTAFIRLLICSSHMRVCHLKYIFQK